MKRPVRVNVSSKSLILMGIPRIFTHSNITDFRTYEDKGLSDVKSFVTNYIDNIVCNIEKGKGILFNGSNGVGKTMLSSIILKEAYRYRYSCRRVTFAKYISEYTSSWNKNGSDKEDIQQEVFETYKSAELLVLEEIGKEIDSKIAKPILEDLLRYREEHCLATIICTNLSVKNIREEYGNSVFSIMTGIMTPVTLVGKDRRAEAFREE